MDTETCKHVLMHEDTHTYAEHPPIHTYTHRYKYTHTQTHTHTHTHTCMYVLTHTHRTHRFTKQRHGTLRRNQLANKNGTTLVQRD
jgi:hypothetical protein